MGFSRNWLMSAAALVALGACTTAAPGESSSAQATTGAFAGKSTLEAAIDAAGGETALGAVKELYWTGTAKVTAPDKVVDLNVATLVRPFQNARYTSWLKGEEAKTSRTIQVEQGKGWVINRVTWLPMPAPQAQNENEQMWLYSLMLLAPLKSGDVTLADLPAAADGTRVVKATYQGKAFELAFDANAKLVRASNAVTDAKGGADIAQVATFSGEVTSNGVKWPRRISITQNGAPFYEVDIATFEALPQRTVRPMEQSMQYEPEKVVPGAADAG